MRQLVYLFPMSIKYRCVSCVYQDCPCQHQSPAPDMRHSSFSAVCPGEELSENTEHTYFNTPPFHHHLRFYHHHKHNTNMHFTHPTHITALSQHLVSFEQVVSHQLADFVLSLPASLDHLHLCLRWRLPLEVLVIWGESQRNADLILQYCTHTYTVLHY